MTEVDLRKSKVIAGPAYKPGKCRICGGVIIGSKCIRCGQTQSAAPPSK